jgi:hypothetical protein
VPEFIRIKSTCLGNWGSFPSDDFNEVHSNLFGYNNWKLVHNKLIPKLLLPHAYSFWMSKPILINQIVPEFDSGFAVKTPVSEYVSITQKLEHADSWHNDL